MKYFQWTCIEGKDPFKASFGYLQSIVLGSKYAFSAKVLFHFNSSTRLVAIEK